MIIADFLFHAVGTPEALGNGLLEKSNSFFENSLG
jgi:hypothetical protein